MGLKKRIEIPYLIFILFLTSCDNSELNICQDKLSEFSTREYLTRLDSLECLASCLKEIPCLESKESRFNAFYFRVGDKIALVFINYFKIDSSSSELSSNSAEILSIEFDELNLGTRIIYPLSSKPDGWSRLAFSSFNLFFGDGDLKIAEYELDHYRVNRINISMINSDTKVIEGTFELNFNLLRSNGEDVTKYVSFRKGVFRAKEIM